jgi:hypothetical protein
MGASGAGLWVHLMTALHLVRALTQVELSVLRRWCFYIARLVDLVAAEHERLASTSCHVKSSDDASLRRMVLGFFRAHHERTRDFESTEIPVTDVAHPEAAVNMVTSEYFSVTRTVRW